METAGDVDGIILLRLSSLRRDVGPTHNAAYAVMRCLSVRPSRSCILSK